jgi:urease accessory protein
MIELTERTPVPPDLSPTLNLTRDQRGRARLRAMMSDGREVAILLPRGGALRDGDGLGSVDGLRVRVCAAAETLSRVECTDPLALARACYHLGNRHVALQIEPGQVSYLHDHVLDAMLAGLGLKVRVVTAPFEPEPGAYGGQGHGHSHGHEG